MNRLLDGPMIYDFQLTKDYLKSEFETRVRKNPRYSLRSFAQFLKVPA